MDTDWKMDTEKIDVEFLGIIALIIEFPAEHFFHIRVWSLQGVKTPMWDGYYLNTAQIHIFKIL